MTQPTQTGFARSPFLFGSGTLDFDQDELNDLTEQSIGTNLPPTSRHQF
jgi:hypothetical protein